MKRSTKKAQKIKQIGYQEEESSKKKFIRKNGNNEKIVYGRGEHTTISRKKWSNRRSRGRKMKRSTKKVQKIKQIGYRDKESNQKKCIKKRGR